MRMALERLAVQEGLGRPVLLERPVVEEVVVVGRLPVETGLVR